MKISVRRHSRMQLTQLALTLHVVAALPVWAGTASPAHSESVADMHLPVQSTHRRAALGRFGCSRPGNGQEVEAERGWEEVRKMMAEACSGGSGGASTHLSGHGSLPAAPLPSQALAINPADVDSKGPVGAGVTFPPAPPTHLEGQGGGGGTRGWVGVGLLKRLRTYWLGESVAHTKRTRMRHDEVCYRTNTFPVAKRYASSDWLHILWSFPRSTIMVNILSPVLVTTAWTCMIALLHRGLPPFVYKLLQACSGCVAGTSLRMPCRVLEAAAPTAGRIAFLKGFSKQPHSIVGSAMSLLLVFRTNTAYTRFWEGRCLWEAVSDNLRDIMRMCVVYRDKVGESNLKRIADLACAFPVALKHHLEGFQGHHQEEELGRLVNPLDLPGVLCAVNRPLYITSALQHMIVHDIKYQGDGWTVRERLLLCQLLNQLSKCIGGCERIVQTPVPLHYARHTGRFMGLFILTLPFILVDDMGLLAVPAVAIMVWCLFGVQEIGLLIENPFSRSSEGTWALPLGVMAETIRFDIWDAIDTPAPPSISKFKANQQFREVHQLPSDTLRAPSAPSDTTLAPPSPPSDTPAPPTRPPSSPSSLLPPAPLSHPSLPSSPPASDSSAQFAPSPPPADKSASGASSASATCTSTSTQSGQLRHT